MSSQLKKQPILALFGQKYGTQLINSLTSCCPSTPAISLTFTATCAGYDDKGNLTYNVTASATYNKSISGYTALTAYFSDQPFPDMTAITSAIMNSIKLNSASVFVSNITAGNPCVFANIVADNMNPGTYYGMVSDNRGNHATPITITFPVCPKG